MYKEILRSIGGIDIYPVLSLIIFLTCFAVAVARALRMDARRAGRLAALPLDSSDESISERIVTIEVRR